VEAQKAAKARFDSPPDPDKPADLKGEADFACSASRQGRDLE